MPVGSSSGSALRIPMGPNRRPRRYSSYGAPWPTVRATTEEMMFDVPDE